MLLRLTRYWIDTKNKIKGEINEYREKRQELFCHHCNNYVQFDLYLSLEGNHILLCPVCQHEHCRVVKGRKITDIR